MSKLSSTLCALAFLGAVSAEASSIVADGKGDSGERKYEDGHLTPRELITKYGYCGESHSVVTDDGYILEIHRITGPNSDSKPDGKEPVLLFHGLFGTSINWILPGPGKSLAFLLADNGHDVWIGNSRGNLHSRNHTKMSGDMKSFWQFSWHEIGIRDVPATIDYILERTEKQRITFVGYSMGSTVFFAMASELPEYQAKVNAMFALGPVAYMEHSHSPFLRVVAKLSYSIEELTGLFGYDEFAPTSEFMKRILDIACKDGSVAQNLCTFSLALVSGFGSDQLNKTMLPVISRNGGGSVKQLIHYLQLVKSGGFRQYDHGLAGNFIKYGQRRAPHYHLSNITVPVYLHYARNDVFATPADIDRLYNELGNPIGKFEVAYEKFTHLDFTWAKDIKRLVYDLILEQMTKICPSVRRA